MAMASLQLDAGLALNGCKKTGAEVTATVHRHRNRLTALGQDVVAAVHSAQGPTRSLELGNDLFAVHRPMIDQ